MHNARKILLCTILSAFFCLVLPWRPIGLISCIPGYAENLADQNATTADDGADQARAGLKERIFDLTSSVLIKLGMDKEMVKLYATWIVGAPILVVLVIIAMLLRPRRRPREEATAQIQTKPKSKAPALRGRAKSRPIFPKDENKLTDKQRVLRFFFQLFRNQINADANAPTELYLVEMRPTCPNETYEMRIQQNGEWITRRMSIGLLGQGGGSRSKCFYVIYDAHMVIKLPSDPVTSFFTYNRQIAAEAAIVDRLAPRECIVPRVSVILKEITSIPGADKLSPEELEKKYVHMVEVKPVYQEYLQIGNSFAFFMDLARHFFLSATIDEIHSGSLSLVDEALQHPELLWDHNGFVCRYGEEAGGVCHDLQEIYHRCEKELRRIIDSEAGDRKEITGFRFKQWFLMHLTGEQLNPVKEKLPDGIIDKINKTLLQAVKSKAKEVERYRRNLKNYVFETRFSKHRNQLECLASNTLDLLAWVGAKSMAMRDLKPENLFVAGNPDEYPVFLNDTRNFSIGLIDVETAVVFDAENPADIPQPQLAGTPLYATPSHLMANSLLLEVYPDLAAILRMQDWYATIGIIFKIFTGENLFTATARVFPEILKRLKLVNPAGPDLEQDVARINHIFWNSGQAELQESLLTHKNVLRRVEVNIPAPFVKDIIKALHRDIQAINQAIAQTVKDQSFFTSAKKQNFLLDASAYKIRSMKAKLVQEKANPGDKSATAQQKKILAFFDHLGDLKDHLQRKLEAAANLKATGAPIAADQLLEAMFRQVFCTHFLEHWTPLTPAKWSGKVDVPDDLDTYQATM